LLLKFWYRESEGIHIACHSSLENKGSTPLGIVQAHPTFKSLFLFSRLFILFFSNTKKYILMLSPYTAITTSNTNRTSLFRPLSLFLLCVSFFLLLCLSMILSLSLKQAHTQTRTFSLFQHIILVFVLLSSILFLIYLSLFVFKLLLQASQPVCNPDPPLCTTNEPMQ
jgi:hypothetical protein